MIYLDAAATAPPRQEVLQAMWPLMSTNFGNPSSHHALGETAAAAHKAARQQAATVLGCRPSELTFTSGGTEANNLALKGIALAAPRDRHLVTSAVEHPAVLETLDYLHRFHGFRITVVPVSATGLVEPDSLQKALTPGTTLCSIMYANNEVGTVQPLRVLAGLCAAASVPFHTDAVQAGAWLPLSVAELGVDALTLSGHKLGAPKGAGLLYLKGRIPVEPLIHGGGQERGRRSGTENVAGAVGLATALALAQDERDTAVPAAKAQRDYLINHVLDTVPGAVLTGDREQRLPNLASFCFPGTSGESVLLELERRGVVCSSGSACAAGSDEPSAVLLALGIDRTTAQTAVRFSWTAATTERDMALASRAVTAAVASVRALGRPA
ncbi:cysteine desulfurase family protein [Arthrobacter sp. Bz4]|uniref:cysteine desulfurase family protein n=1 Tax=Arthrobacter sp. Bz4 TaxID=2171979 RepID=UPI000D51D5DA|nr:cysteine desulfurase family protein [Arthrobacter sp. Bz4]PVE17867.1 cysteine desulfurase [Arthrobacter sp. Bz4]